MQDVDSCESWIGVKIYMQRVSSEAWAFLVQRITQLKKTSFGAFPQTSTKTALEDFNMLDSGSIQGR